ncbi:MAG: hypothetical protein GY795_37560 [Desulfobacterales bacterium]|nr:hypothetical protein [Desulfobacterales bacterium]
MGALSLHDNQISDIKPLADNIGIGSNDDYTSTCKYVSVSTNNWLHYKVCLIV